MFGISPWHNYGHPIDQRNLKNLGKMLQHSPPPKHWVWAVIIDPVLQAISLLCIHPPRYLLFTFGSTFNLLCCCTHPKVMTRWKKCATGQSCIHKKVTSYKNHTLGAYCVNIYTVEWRKGALAACCGGLLYCTAVPYTHDYTYCAIALQKTKTSCQVDYDRIS